MNYKNWINKNTATLEGKKVAISGSTGGLGREICFYLASLSAQLILMDRNSQKADELKAAILKKYPQVNISHIRLDLSDMDTVFSACDELEKINPNIIILNAGAYSVPRFKCSTGLDNVFQINFAAPYYIVNRLLPTLRANGGRVVAVGSIAHNYSKTDQGDIDFSKRKKASLVYGNAKRYLMFSLFELFKSEKDVALSVVHPGITFTNITAHYPKIIFAIIKHPMKIIFMPPKKAALCVVKGIYQKTDYHKWIGPGFLNIWGLPKYRKLKTCTKEESITIGKTAEKIYQDIKK